MKPTITYITYLMIVLFCASSSFAQAKRGKRSAIPTPYASGRCAVTVRNDLLPNRTVVVVGCADFGISEVKSPDGEIAGYRPTNGGIVVFDDELNLIFKWEACSACGGFFSHFAGTKKVQGHNALMIKLVDGPLMEGGGRAEPTVPLYFDGRQFRFAEMPQ